jgi:hypothetical protein
MVHGLHVVYGHWCDIYKGGNLCVNIKKGIEFYSAFSFTNLCQPKNTQAEIYCRGIKCTDLSFCRKIVISLYIPGNTDQIRNELFEYLAVTAMIGFCQLAPGYALPSPK